MGLISVNETLNRRASLVLLAKQLGMVEDLFKKKKKKAQLK